MGDEAEERERVEAIEGVGEGGKWERGGEPMEGWVGRGIGKSKEGGCWLLAKDATWSRTFGYWSLLFSCLSRT
jgi:hypothetical protein